MYFRFGCGLTLVVAISLAGLVLEKRSLELRRAITHQQYRLDVLLQRHTHERMQTQQYAAPSRLLTQVPVLSDAPSPEVKPAGQAKPKKPARPATPPANRRPTADKPLTAPVATPE